MLPFLWDTVRSFDCNDFSRQPESLQGADFENDGRWCSEKPSDMQPTCTWLLYADRWSSTSTESTWPVLGSAQHETTPSTECEWRAVAVSDARDESFPVSSTLLMAAAVVEWWQHRCEPLVIKNWMCLHDRDVTVHFHVGPFEAWVCQSC